MAAAWWSPDGMSWLRITPEDDVVPATAAKRGILAMAVERRTPVAFGFGFLGAAHGPVVWRADLLGR